ncbi:DNA-3-methyladenine glycosylase I [bacterium]|nr:DNA-3-methyladenine glycosylase I [bacterium]
MNNSFKRCAWVGDGKELMALYHDQEWGIEVHDDQKHFEFLVLEGAQAGLSWETILKRREGYRRLFHQFDPQRVAKMTEQELEQALLDPGIIRNRKKVYSVRQNAIVFLDIQKEFGSFNEYIWSFVGGKQIKNSWKTLSEIPATSKESDALAKDLKKRKMSFVGSTVTYAHLQAAGLINDHTIDCFRYDGEPKTHT